MTQQEVSELRKVWIQEPFGFSKLQQVFALVQFWPSNRNESESSWFKEITAFKKKKKNHDSDGNDVSLSPGSGVQLLQLLHMEGATQLNKVVFR